MQTGPKRSSCPGAPDRDLGPADTPYSGLGSLPLSEEPQHTALKNCRQAMGPGFRVPQKGATAVDWLGYRGGQQAASRRQV